MDVVRGHDNLGMDQTLAEEKSEGLKPPPPTSEELDKKDVELALNHDEDTEETFEDDLDYESGPCMAHVDKFHKCIVESYDK